MPAAALLPGSARFLVIDSDRQLADILSDGPLVQNVLQVANGYAGVAALQASTYDVVLADLDSLADLADGTESAVTQLAQLGGTAFLFVVTNTDSVSAAVEALQAGAHDCLVKPFSVEDLLERIATVRSYYARHSLAPSPVRASSSGSGRFIAHAPQTRVILAQLAKIASSSAPVFLSGEGGTGKRLAAETLHALGPHPDRPFVAVDCARIVTPGDEPDSHKCLTQLIGSENAKTVIRAGGGTLYLHNIDVLRAEAQAHLFCLVDPDDALPSVGGGTSYLSLRIVCSTRQNLVVLIKQRTMRLDLFYRLHVLPLYLPPLRQRPEDIAPLAVTFLRGFARAAGKGFTGFSPAALGYLEAHDWPDNVRQLENLMRRTITMFDGSVVTPQMLAAADIEGMTDSGGALLSSPASEGDILPMWQQEQRIIEAAIAHFGGNIARAAAALEISPSTIYRKKQAWEDQTGGFAGAA